MRAAVEATEAPKPFWARRRYAASRLFFARGGLRSSSARARATSPSWSTANSSGQPGTDGRVDAQGFELGCDSLGAAALGQAAAHQHLGVAGVVHEPAEASARPTAASAASGGNPFAYESCPQRGRGLLACESEALDLAEGALGVVRSQGFNRRRWRDSASARAREAAGCGAQVIFLLQGIERLAGGVERPT